MTKKEIEIIKEIFIERMSALEHSVNEKMDEMHTSIAEFRKNLATLQDVVIGMNNYIEGELKVALSSMDRDIHIHNSKFTKQDKRIHSLEQRVL